MILDNLSIAGLLFASLYLLLPLLFGREVWRVSEDDGAKGTEPATFEGGVDPAWDCSGESAPCAEG
jgi:hypothetical protein